MKLHYHPLSSYSQKVLIALYENGVKFEPVIADITTPEGRAEYRKLNPFGKLPYLSVEEKDWRVPESAIIIEYVDRHFPGATRLIPDDPDLARQTRMRERLFDLYVNDPMQKIFFDGHRPAGKNDPYGVERARETLDSSFAVLDRAIAGKTWVMGDAFTVADCAAAPALGYCKMLHPFDKHPNLTAYYGRLLERPSYQRVMKEAAPYLAKAAAR